MPREKPLNIIHLRNMGRVTEDGATVVPPNLETTGVDVEGSVEEPVRRKMVEVLEFLGMTPP